MKLLLSLLLVCIGCGSLAQKPKTKAESKIHVMAFNIHHGAPRSSEIVNLDDVVSAIKAGKADLVALQEVDKGVKRSGNVDQAKELADKLDMHYYFSKSIDYQGGDYGVAVLSKYPIVSSQQLILPNNFSKGEQRTLAYVTVELPDRTQLDFASVHLDLVPGNRAEQTAFLNQLNQKTKNPLILAGDFNGEPQDAEIQALQSDFHMLCNQNCPLTFPTGEPTKTIDYIFLNSKAKEKFKLTSYQALEDQQCSDHLPLLGVFTY